MLGGMFRGGYAGDWSMSRPRAFRHRCCYCLLMRVLALRSFAFGVLALVIIWARYEETGFALGRKDRGIVSQELSKVHGVPRRTRDLDFYKADDLFFF